MPDRPMSRDLNSVIPTLYRTTRDLMQASDRTEVCETTVESAQAILDIPVVGVHLHDGEGRLVPIAASDAVVKRTGGEVPTYTADSTDRNDRLVWGAYRAGEIYRFAEDEDNHITRDGLFVPVGDDGIMLAFPPRKRTFSEVEITAVEILASNTEESLARLDREQRLRRKNERLEQFASVVSHDLRNPLQVADGRLQLARQDCESEHYEAIARAHERMERLIEDLLTLAQEGAGEQEATVDLAEAVEAAWQEVPTPQATLDIETDRSVRADPRRLQQLFANLVRNAVEHGSTSRQPPADDAVEHGSPSDLTGSDDAVEHGGADVTVRVTDLEDGHGFAVVDDGPGLPSEDRDRLFEYGRSTDADGTGLGLAIVRTVAREHGWSVTATDAADGGARFEVAGVDIVG